MSKNNKITNKRVRDRYKGGSKREKMMEVRDKTHRNRKLNRNKEHNKINKSKYNSDSR